MAQQPPFQRGYKPVSGVGKSSWPAHHIASQFGNVKEQLPVEGEKAERDMYEVDRQQDTMAKNPYGITHGKP